MGDLKLGRAADGASDAVIDSKILLDHTIVIGAKGMGKTSFGRVLLDGVINLDCPVLMVDTTGDMTARLMKELELPLLRGVDPKPQSAKRVHLRSIGLDFIEGIFLRSPADGTSRELLADELDDLVGAMLGLAGFRTKKLSPEFALIEALVWREWSEGRDVHIHDLVELIERPNIAQIGIFQLDDVISSERREDLAGAIDGALRSLSADTAAREPQPIDIGHLLYDGDAAAATVLSFATGADRIQKFIVAALLAKLKTYAAQHWSEDDRLRALVYLDEASNLLPAGRKAITTVPLLSALDGWLKFGIGLVLVAEEVSDLHESVEDLCQTWIVGRMPSAKARLTVVDNLDLVNPPVDEIKLEQTVNRLDVGHFVLRSCRLDTLLPFHLA